jgi:hypothetical protein
MKKKYLNQREIGRPFAVCRYTELDKFGRPNEGVVVGVLTSFDREHASIRPYEKGRPKRYNLLFLIENIWPIAREYLSPPKSDPLHELVLDQHNVEMIQASWRLRRFLDGGGDIRTFLDNPLSA